MRTRYQIITVLSPLLLAISLVAADNGASTDSGAPVPPTRRYPMAQSPAVWRALLYLQGVGYFDEGTWVEGGVEGSAMLVIPDQSSPNRDDWKTKWVFIEGAKMYMRIPGEPKEYFTISPGNYMVSSNGDWDPTPRDDFDLRRLSFYLSKLGDKSNLPGKKAEDSKRYAPFLVGSGWPGGGASKEVTDALLRAMDVNLKTLGPTVGRVKFQFPDPGTPFLNTKAEMAVVLDGNAVTRLGRTPASPIVLDTNSNGQKLEEFILTTDIDDTEGDCEPDEPVDPSKPDEKESYVDLFFRLPFVNKNKHVEVKVRGQKGPSLILTGWQTDDLNGVLTFIGCEQNRQPTLELDTDAAKKFTLFSVDIKESRLNEHGPELVELEVSW